MKKNTSQAQTDILSPSSVGDYLSEGYSGDVYCHRSIPSTNDEAKRLALLGAGHGTVVCADTQTNGRGRRGNSFHSPVDTGIYMSVIIRQSSERSDTLYTVAAAVAVRRVLDRYCNGNARIKWVNDIYISEQKVCGILCEAVTKPESAEPVSVICGIGINLNAPKQDFPKELQGKAGYVTDKSISRAKVIAEIVNELLSVLELENEDIMPEYTSNMMLLKKKIYYRENGVLKEAEAIGVDMSGGLIVKDVEQNTAILRSGEVHLERF